MACRAMAEGGFTVSDDGSWLLFGELDFETVPSLLDHPDVALKAGKDIRVDFSEVTRVDSAGLALMIDWMRKAERAGLSITFENVPEQLHSIARICDLDEILFLPRPDK